MKRELDKACFQHDMAYEDFKGLARGTASHNIFCIKAFHIAKKSKYDGYQGGLFSMVSRGRTTIVFDKRSYASGIKIRIFQKKN